MTILSHILKMFRKQFKTPPPAPATNATTPNDSPSSSQPSQSAKGAGEPNFEWMDGRRFNTSEGAAYMLPNDPSETDRLVGQHFMVKAVFSGRTFHAPVHELLEEGIRVLDVGCGPGTWMMDMATAYPLSNFVGIDIADDTFPQIIRPANTEFVQENVLNGLPFEDASFDYVFMRFMALAFVKEDWARVVAELCRVVRPGGFIEMVELDMEGKRPGPESKNMFTRLSKGLQARGVDPVIARRIDKLLISAELMDVNKGFGSIPVHWGGKLGEAMADDVRCAMKGLMRFYTTTLHYTVEQVEMMMVQTERESVEHRTYLNFHYAFGQRPLGG